MVLQINPCWDSHCQRTTQNLWCFQSPFVEFVKKYGTFNEGHSSLNEMLTPFHLPFISNLVWFLFTRAFPMYASQMLRRCVPDVAQVPATASHIASCEVLPRNLAPCNPLHERSSFISLSSFFKLFEKICEGFHAGFYSISFIAKVTHVSEISHGDLNNVDKIFVKIC